MKKIIIIVLFCIPTLGRACSCVSLTQKGARKITQQADYVIIGTAIENVHHDPGLKAKLDSTSHGTDIKFKVNQIIKGRVESNFVNINQLETGNCIQQFKLGEKYVIVGTQVQDFVNQRLSSDDGNEFFELIETPPSSVIGGITNKRLNCYNTEKETINL